MPPRTRANIDQLMSKIDGLEASSRRKAIAYSEETTPRGLFELLHGMRRWYSGQTMIGKLIEHHDALADVMDLDPDDAKGVFRGFKVPNDHELARSSVGDITTIPVTRNRGVSSWSTKQELTNRFSGGGNGKTGLIVKLVDTDGVRPLLAPPSHTEPWFNQMYDATIGKSFRPNEHEYLLQAPRVKVEIVRVKKAFEAGRLAALTHFKLAGPMGADIGVQPKGDEVSHGTERVPYAARETPSDGAPTLDGSEAGANMPDWLWDNFTTYDRAAPGRADGTFGQEVIG